MEYFHEKNNSSVNDGERRSNLNLWTEFERTKLQTRSKRQRMYNKYTRTFNESLILKLKDSVFGSFLDIFNLQQNSDKDFNNLKLDITEFNMRSFTEKDIDRFHRNNEFIDDSYEYLKHIIKEERPVSLDDLVKSMKCLKLNSFYVSVAVF